MTVYTKLKIILVIVLATVISIGSYNYLKSLKDEVTIVIAAQDIEERCWIKPEMLKEVSIGKKERGILASDSLTSIGEIDMAVSLVKISKGKVINLKEDIRMGTQQSLLENKVITENGEINNAYFVSNNKRIITIRVDSQGAVANKINTGDFVDVIFTSTGDNAGNFSTCILQHIQVNDIEKLKDKSVDAIQNISLIVTPQQAVDLTFAKRNGKIDLVLNPIKGENELIYPVSIKKFTELFVSDKGDRKK